MVMVNYQFQQQLMNADKDEEEGDTIQFLKVRLMERDREISDFQAKTKKTQFKHNRDIRELKVAEQRARTLLKQQKTRCDKLARQLREIQEEATLLRGRLSESIKQREREVGEIRGMYNSLKLQVRGYERILPTLTFLLDQSLTIGQIPPYEDVFISLREKIIQLQQTQIRFEGFRKQNEQAILTYKQNELLLQAKNYELQRMLRQMSPKMAELQHIVIELTTTKNQLLTAKIELQEILQNQRKHCFQLQTTVREGQLRVQQLQREFSCQLQNKQQEIHAITQEQFQRYENEIRSLEERIQSKDKMYLQQIQLLQEEVYYLQSRMAQEKDQFEQSFLEIKGQIEKMQDRIQREKSQQQELRSRYEQAVLSLVNSAKAKEQLEIKLKNLQRKNENYQFQRRLSGSGKAVPDIQMSQIQNLQQKYDDLLEKFQEKTVLVDKLQEQNVLLEEETAALRVEVLSKNTPHSHQLELPAHFLEFDETWKKQSNESQFSQKIVIETNKEDSTVIKLNKELQQSKQEILTLRNNIKSFQSSLIDLNKQNCLFQQKLSKNEIENQQLNNEKTILTKEKVKYFEQITFLKQKMEKLVRQIKDKETQINSQSNNLSLQKSRLEVYQQENKRLADELKRERQSGKNLKQELKKVKEEGFKINENYNSKFKELNSVIQSIKNQNEKLKIEGISKQKSFLQEISKLNGTIQLQQKKIIHSMTFHQHIQKLQQQIQSLLQNNSKLTKENTMIKNESDKISDDLKKRQREVSCLAEALTRQRKQRALKSVPSLPVFAQDTQVQFSNDIDQMMIQKQDHIHRLQRQVSDLRQQIEGLKISQIAKLEGMQSQNSHYIQTIIQMKMKCAQSQMKAAECQYLYSQFKKKYVSKTSN